MTGGDPPPKDLADVSYKSTEAAWNLQTEQQKTQEAGIGRCEDQPKHQQVDRA